ncbi:MAG: hypothetical protein PHW82_10825 [Bacteroidales bacterium]|nr:hypothetical protein [Bacteroidales bacterium]
MAKIILQFEEECAAIEQKISKIDENAAVDGVINPQKYFNLSNDKPRILWVLKEPNTEGETGVGWSYKDLFSIDNLTANPKLLGIQTLSQVFYVSYSILNNFMEWGEVPHKSKIETISIGEQIAYININKGLGGKGSVNDKKIEDAYLIYRGILKEQIEVYNPDIIIFGNTLQYIDKEVIDRDMFSVKSIDTEKYKTTYYESDKRLMIWAYHPGARANTISQQTYFEEIVSISKAWWNNRQ